MSAEPLVLAIDDEPALLRLIKLEMTGQGFRVITADSGAAGVKMEEEHRPDIVLLDLSMPEMDGLEVMRQIRDRTNIPIILLTAKGSDGDKVRGLEMGADDYLAKPFEPRELLARLKAILRRSRGGQSIDVLRFGRLEIDAGARQVRLDGSEVALTGHQFALLLELARHPGRVMSRDALMELVRNEPLEAFDRSIDVHISRIRAAIEDDAARPRRVITVRGAGYVFAKDQS
jgi:DNA-binding response OmpR family regulator